MESQRKRWLISSKHDQESRIQIKTVEEEEEEGKNNHTRKAMGENKMAERLSLNGKRKEIELALAKDSRYLPRTDDRQKLDRIWRG